MSRGWAVFAVVAVLSLGGCAASDAQSDAGDADPPVESSAPAGSPSAEAEAEGEIVALASISEVGGTRWTGTDSDGDSHGLTFTDDGTVTHSQSGVRQESTWVVEDETVVFTIVFGPGSVTEITGTLDPATQTISAVGVDSLGEVTFEFTRLD